MIKGLTDRVRSFVPTIGKLKKGEPKPAGKGMGRDTDHWRFSSDNQRATEIFKDLYGDDPVLLHVYLPFPTLDQNWETCKEAWGAGERLSHRCDGETCSKWRDADNKFHFEPKPCPGGCKEVGRLLVVLPEMVERGVGGLITVETHSLNDIARLQSALLGIADLRAGESNGLKGVKCLLRRKQSQIGNGQGGRRSAWLIALEPLDDTWTNTAQALPFSERPGATVDEETGEVFVSSEDADGETIPANGNGKAAAITPEQKKRMGELMAQLYTKDELDGVRQSMQDIYGVSRRDDLTQAQAADLIADLERNAAGRQVEQQPLIQPEPAVAVDPAY